MRWKGLVPPFVLVAGWELASRADLVPLQTMSRPSDISAAWWTEFSSGALLIATLQTLQATFLGFLIATAIGILTGLVVGLSSAARLMVSPSLEALRPVPPVALIPISLLLLGFGVSMEAAVIAFACVWPILIATTAAVRASESRLYELAQILELSAFSYARKFVLPAALGRIGVGMRIGLGIALVVAVTVEIVVNPRGLGYGLIMAQQSMRPDSMYAQLLWVGIIGSVLNLLLTQFDRRILRLYAGGSSR
jgi:ABC-type nitrate/sulfonate/bicarbonate transport system permease component